MSIFNTAPGTFTEGLDTSNIILSDSSNQIRFGGDEATILNINTSQDKNINIKDVNKDIDLVYTDAGSNNITDFTIQNSVNFTGGLSGDVNGSQSNTVVQSVNGKTKEEISQVVNDVQNATHFIPFDQIVKTNANGKIYLQTLDVEDGIICHSQFSDIIAANFTGNLTGNASSSTIANTANSATNFTGSLSGDIGGTQSATVVNSVGEHTSTEIDIAINQVETATTSVVPHTIAKRNFFGDIYFSRVYGTKFLGPLEGNVTGNLTGDASNSLLLNNKSENSGNVLNTIVSRNASGNFSANIITANSFSGTATNASQLNNKSENSSNSNNTIVSRDASGNSSFNEITCNTINVTNFTSDNTLNVGSKSQSEVEESVDITDKFSAFNGDYYLSKSLHPNSQLGIYTLGYPGDIIIPEARWGNIYTIQLNSYNIIDNGSNVVISSDLKLNSITSNASTITINDDIIPSINSLKCGNISNPWAEGAFNNLITSGISDINGVLEFKDHLLPNTALIDIGDTTNRFRNLYSKNLYLKNDIDNCLLVETSTGTDVLKVDTNNQRVTVKEFISNNISDTSNTVTIDANVNEITGTSSTEKFMVYTGGSKVLLRCNTSNERVVIEGTDDTGKFGIRKDAGGGTIFNVDTVNDITYIEKLETDVFETTGNSITIDGTGTNNASFLQCLDTIGNEYFRMRSNDARILMRGQNHSTKFLIQNNSNVNKFWVNSSTGNAYITGGTLVTSDEREKEEIQDTDLGLEFINLLKPKKYKWKDKEKDNKNHYGFLSQDLEALDQNKDQSFYDKVDIEDDEGNKTGEHQYFLNYIEFIAPMIKSIQELTDIVISQQGLIEDLNNEINKIKSK